MKLASFEHEKRANWGLLEEDGILPVQEETRMRFPTLAAALRAGHLSESEVRFGEHPLPLSEIRLCPPISDPGKIICVGRNYGAHVAETGMKKPNYPSLFVRFADTLVASGAPLVRPRISDEFDFEGEIAVIVGKAGRHIAEQDALSHVFGYSIFNDASVRDVQLLHSLTAGKNFHRTGGFGPGILTADEIRDYRSLSLTTRLNGNVMQHGTLSDMLFNLEFLLSYISRFTPISPGDVIVTGTPEGVGLARKPPVWLIPGDVVTVEVPELGILVNPIIDEEMAAS
jgi:2-keto-4-pentenoate hydratase/2-oxohepta-3-ene-1,7-dioic acid hydratase in catechol pathway